MINFKSTQQRSLQKNDRPRQSEDCLYLNVWTNRVRKQDKRPVMVWIHGGGFAQGSGHQGGYDGTQLAKRGAVVVTIHYRLGALGLRRRIVVSYLRYRLLRHREQRDLASARFGSDWPSQPGGMP
ncbi:Para-nitrobenzyl esterase [Stieleria neptunia]|uniref:Para-nitrobenzyl esterase n=1 Tax=Stieleria neptunia TaxID=2527979 RepID=A0A518I380_9BACT|nr:Para-nitrobenzyl esterase [Stieleria neptunia]